MLSPLTRRTHSLDVGRRIMMKSNISSAVGSHPILPPPSAALEKRGARIMHRCIALFCLTIFPCLPSLAEEAKPWNLTGRVEIEHRDDIFKAKVFLRNPTRQTISFASGHAGAGRTPVPTFTCENIPLVPAHIRKPLEGDTEAFTLLRRGRELLYDEYLLVYPPLNPGEYPLSVSFQFGEEPEHVLEIETKLKVPEHSLSMEPSDRVLSYQTQVFIHDKPWAIVLILPEEAMEKREGMYQIGEGENTFSAEIHHGPYIDRFVRVPAGPATPPIPDNDPRYSKWNAESGRVSCRLLHPEKDERYPAVEIQVHDLRFDRFRIENIGPFRTDLGVPVRP